jgi:type IV pilus assembly protein PilF
MSVQRAIEIDADYAPAYNAMALIFQAEQEFELAEDYFRKALAADKTSAMIHNNYGAFLFARQRYSEACNQLQQATMDPFYAQRAQAFENLGRCYLLIDSPNEAKEAFRRSLAINGNRPIALVELSALLFEEGDIASSARLFERFRELVEQKRAEHTARSLWQGIKLARAERNVSRAATYALLLKNMYPQSQEYRLYEETAQ